MTRQWHLLQFASFLVAVSLASSASPMDHVVLMDGTWNNSIRSEDGDSKASPTYTVRIVDGSTNIARLWPLLRHKPDQRVIYVRGIGTDDNPLDVADGAFGKEAREKVNVAYRALSNGWKEGDGIVVFGFSRGAATARMLARLLHDEGLGGIKPVTVRFMGLFDTVASMGIPRFSAADFTNIESYHKEFDQKIRELAIPSSVKHVVHLVALDEDRSVFAPTLVVLDDRRQGTVVDEVWFGGNHGDVGGGWTSDEEGDKEFRRRMITLRFMLEQPHGLDLIEKWKSHPDVRVDPIGTRCGTKHGWGDYSFKTRITGRLPRSIQELPPGAQMPVKVHPTANK